MKKAASILMAAGAVSLLFSDGAALYKERCAPCHGAKGEKKALGVSSHIGEKPADFIFESLKLYKSGLLTRYGNGMIMKSQAASLTDAEMKAIADYIGKKQTK